MRGKIDACYRNEHQATVLREHLQTQDEPIATAPRSARRPYQGIQDWTAQMGGFALSWDVMK